MKDTFYFSHDYSTRQDSKIEKLIFKLDWKGYGLFWAVVEMLYQNEGRYECEYERIAFALRTECETIKSVVEDFGLFKNDGKVFWSESILRRLEDRKNKSNKAKESAMSRWNKEDANAMRTHSEGNAIKERKGKEIKGKEIEREEPQKNLMKEFSEKISNQDQEYIESFIGSVSEKMKLDRELVKKEVQKFWLYWTESNGKKMKWEMEKTFELDRRLLTWLSNVNKFSPKLDKKKDNWVTF